jgi:glutamyl-tRNA synthetase
MSTFRIRQAPSPTGYLHLGTTRQILFTKLFAISQKGVYYLRLEDTDRARLQQDSAKQMLQTLQQLYLLPDEGITLPDRFKNYDNLVGPDDFYGIYQTGNYGPYIQSQRLPLYHQHAQNLINKRLAYWCYLSESEKQELQEIKKVTRRPINYFQVNLKKNPEERLFQSVEEGLQDPQKPVLRYRIQRQETIVCVDELLGQSEFDLSLEEDFVILKSDGYPTYHLAHLVDDYLMETSLVLRAQEWYSSIARHQTMFLDYWGAGPKYLHIPFILGETGTKKMSKRDGNVNMQDYLDKGYLPEAILNYLAFLGWNPGTDRELYLEPVDFRNLDQVERVNKILNDIAAEFDISKLSKAPARFNLEKLNWFNREYLKMLSLREFVFLGDKNRLHKEKTDKPRVGDYVYLVDFEQQKTYMTYDPKQPGDGYYYPLGGGREGDPIGSLIREVEEESLGQIRLQKEQILPLVDVFINKPFVYHDGSTWTGKHMFFYVYALPVSAINSGKLPDTMNEWLYEWVDLSEVISQNKFVRFSIWQQFCQLHNLPCFLPDDRIVEQYLASILDKNRITTLSEIGSESDCILNYQLADSNLLRWRSISLEESLSNLQEIWSFVESQRLNLLAEQDKLYDLARAYIQGNLELESPIYQQLNFLVNTWENLLKTWLAENHKDTGSYLWPLRVYLSGKPKSPSPFELLAIKRNWQNLPKIDQLITDSSKTV